MNKYKFLGCDGGIAQNTIWILPEIVLTKDHPLLIHKRNLVLNVAFLCFHVEFLWGKEEEK